MSVTDSGKTRRDAMSAHSVLGYFASMERSSSSFMKIVEIQVMDSLKRHASYTPEDYDMLWEVPERDREYIMASKLKTNVAITIDEPLRDLFSW